MTPTQAQIEAARKELRYCTYPDCLCVYCDKPTAAEAGEPKSQDLHDVIKRDLVAAVEGATIERCAQVAENWTDWHFGPDSSPNETIAAAIRALKDKP